MRRAAVNDSIKNINDNPLSRRWKQRYHAQPDDIKKRLDELDNQEINEYQLKVIKRKRVIPQKGDVFLVSPKESLYFFGLVMEGNVNNINGDGLSVVMIFKDKARSIEDSNFTPDFNNLLIPPATVGREYWTRGYFYNVGHMDASFDDVSYGFYDIIDGKYYNEYEQEIPEPGDFHLLGTFGVSTINGIARKINRELIMNSSLLEIPCTVTVDIC